MAKFDKKDLLRSSNFLMCSFFHENSCKKSFILNIYKIVSARYNNKAVGGTNSTASRTTVPFLAEYQSYDICAQKTVSVVLFLCYRGRAWGCAWGNFLKRKLPPHPFKKLETYKGKAPAVGVFYIIQNVQMNFSLVEIVASVANAWRASDAPFLLPFRPRFFSQRERSGSMQAEGRGCPFAVSFLVSPTSPTDILKSVGQTVEAVAVRCRRCDLALVGVQRYARVPKRA